MFDSSFHIEVLGPQANQTVARAAVLAATARWESIVTADLPDVDEGPWGDPVDDVRITVTVAAIDGAGKTLAYADPHYRRPGTNLPIDGIVRVDSADVSNPGLVDILTHEIGHIMGIGTSWSSFVLDTGGADPRYIGPAALAEYRAIAGDLTTPSIPVENTGAVGTRDVHWREATFYNELLTGFYNGTVINPLSRMTAAALIDMGFPGVSLEGADPYNLPNGNPIPTMTSLDAAATSGVGAPFTLTATGVADAGRASDGAGAGVASVRFYRESNGIPGLQATGNITNPDTLISTATVAPWMATVDTTGLAADTYTFYAQAIDALGAVGATKTLTHTIIATTVPTPATPTLDAASDHGPRNDDGITNVNKPLLHGTVAGTIAGTVVDVSSDGVVLGQADVVNGAWSFTPATPLSDGTHAMTATARVNGQTSLTSTPLSIKIDTVAPHASNARFEFITRLGVTFDFDDNVSATVGGEDVGVVNTASGTPSIPTTVTTTATSAFFGFTPITLPGGDYSATLQPAGITDLAGNTLAASAGVTFFYLPGDLDRSRRVDSIDLSILSQHYGQSASAAFGDINYSGVVDFDDLVILAQHYNVALDPMKVAATLQPAPAKRSRTILLVTI